MEFLDEVDMGFRDFKVTQDMKIKMMQNKSLDRCDVNRGSFHINVLQPLDPVHVIGRQGSKLETRNDSQIQLDAKRTSFMTSHNDTTNYNKYIASERKDYFQTFQSPESKIRPGKVHTQIDHFLTTAKRNKRIESPVTEVIKFYRSGSIDSKQEVGGLNSTVSMSNFMRENNTFLNANSQNMRISNNETFSDAEGIEFGGTKMDQVNKKKLAQLRVRNITIIFRANMIA